jgi:hypothetical protein
LIFRYGKPNEILSTLDFLFKEGVMPNYFNVNRNNEMQKQRYQLGEKLYETSEIRDKREKSSENLIIEDNSVYEIDPDCFERAKQNRLNYRSDGLRNK